jgi:hypothetical protein
MQTAPHHTFYASLGRTSARAVLLAWLLITALGVAITVSPAASNIIRKNRPGPGDNELYWAVADRVSAGEGYYPALAHELTARGYPTRNIFNWRTPLPIWLIGHLPYRWIGRAVLGLLGLTVLLLGTELIIREERPRLGRAVLTALLLGGTSLVCSVPNLFIMPVLWAGTLIALSVCAYGLNWRKLAIIAGVLAPFFRDLALPYPLLCAVLAWRERRRKEFAVWIAGLLAWVVFFGLHWLEVTRVMPPGARAHTHSWIQFGGMPFVIATTQVNSYLLLLPLPQGVTAAYLVAALFGLLGWHSVGGRRIAITASAFVLMFSVVGQDFNLYWGLLNSPLLCFGAARAPAALCDLWHAARGSAQASGSSELPENGSNTG